MPTPPLYRAFTADQAVHTAQAALATLAHGPWRISDVSELGDADRRNLILRGVAMNAGGDARPIIIKATRAKDYDPFAATAFETSGLVREWASGVLLGARSAGTARLLASDIGQGVLVFEDHGEALSSLVRPLLHGTAAEAEQALTAYASALARLHAVTIACSAEFAAIVRTALPGVRVPPPGHRWLDTVPPAITALLGGDLPQHELAQMAACLQSPGPWLALAHRDSCPDNVLLGADGTARPVDFEYASPGHALLDAAYWRMGFPTCWCAGSVPGAVADRLDATYRAGLAPFLPEARDDAEFQQQSALIAMIWLFASLEWQLPEALAANGEWGISTLRSRILHHFGTALELCERAGMLPGICRVVAGWRDHLEQLWHPCAPLALYPAFAQSIDSDEPMAMRPPSSTSA